MGFELPIVAMGSDCSSSCADSSVQHCFCKSNLSFIVWVKESWGFLSRPQFDEVEFSILSLSLNICLDRI